MNGLDSEDRSLDVGRVVEGSDVVLLPHDHHSCAAAWGYDLYDRNVMAKLQHVWRIRSVTAQRWLRSS